MDLTITFADIVSGVIAGFISSFMLSLLVMKNSPKIKVSKKIAEENGKFRYKIQNMSNRDIGDTSIRITYRTTKDGTSTRTYNCPVLYSKKSSKYNFYNEARMRLRNTNWKNETELSVNDFFALYKDDSFCCIELEISFYDYNLIFGSAKRFVLQKYTYDSIEFNSVFPKGSLKPISIPKNQEENIET